MTQRKEELGDVRQYSIVKVLELGQVFADDLGTRTERYVYAHISAPVGPEDPVQYAFLAIVPHHGFVHLGTIDPATRDFRAIAPETLYLSHLDRYERGPNSVVCKILVRASRLPHIPTLDKLLKIEGIIIRRELIPSTIPTPLG